MDISVAKERILRVATSKPHYNFTEVATIVQKLDSQSLIAQPEHAEKPKLIIKTRRKVTRFKKGDVFTGCGINNKARPYVIAKVVKNGFYCIPMTTTQDEYALLPSNSRFFKGFLGNYMVFVREQYVEDFFQGILDDTRALNKAIKIIADNFKSDFV